MSSERRPTADRKREIADAALRIIARDGLGRFTTAAVAAEVGLTNGAIFRHFAGMDQIISAAIDRAEAVLFESFPPTEPDPLRRLGQFVCARLTAIRKHPEILRVVYSGELAQAEGAAGGDRVRGLKRRSIAFVRSCLQEAADLGLLREELEPKELTLIVLGTIMAVALVPEARAHDGASASSPPRVWATVERLIRRTSSL
ncbi:MAG: TetR/AcrR family transcriptional regulator [Deltaproteobacteria bacterium]|nr:TetR/AcrR family transcriptional regulator [Deltaproteobacteria bacterium]